MNRGNLSPQRHWDTEAKRRCLSSPCHSASVVKTFGIALIPRGEVPALLLAPERHQGRGLGQALGTCAEVLVRARWGYLILAETSGRPRYARSRAFYRKQGYEAVARIADYYGPADDLIIFAKRWSNPIA